ncbi:MAG: bifunctional serine/threonine-protein kinase/formylglycine-generating enzyme family protein [Deltaproteobacteria bacterium]|nr:bifunctional serine/threonine-protein kinase/formylglycine-generating enzyme family protein [Deltaproteobacteria bacterium]
MSDEGDDVDLTGRVLAGRYRLTKKLGEGGMGAVYVAEQEALGREVALKVIRGGGDPMLQARFRREAKLSSQLVHPNIVTIFDYGDDDGVLFLAMELIRGESLARRLERLRRLSAVETLSVITGIAHALVAAHAAGVVHRDLKPDNVMLATLGKVEVVKVLDFGVAKMLDDGSAAGQKLTHTGMILGTPGYMAPELVMGRPVDQRADLYALGALWYELLVGESIFSADTPIALVMKHLTEAARAPSSATGPGVVPADVDALVLALLQKEPADRPTAADIVDRIGALQRPSSSSSSSSSFATESELVIPVVAPPRRTHRQPAAAIAAGIVVVVVAAIAGLGSGADPTVVAVADAGPTAVVAPLAPVTAGVPLSRDLVAFPAGAGVVGRNGAGALDGPAHVVTLAAFALQRHETTFGELRRFIDSSATGSTGIALPAVPPARIDDKPAVGVAHDKANAWCAWAYAGGRLPSEDEWERAARGPEGRAVPWSGAAPATACANIGEDEDGVVVVADALPCGASPEGLVHLLGNAAEWTSTPASLYPGSSAQRPKAWEAGGLFVVRGGSSTTDVKDALAWRRAFARAPSPYIGFRCAVSLTDDDDDVP